MDVCVENGTLAVELALVKSLELRRGCTFGGAAMVGLSTCGVVLQTKERHNNKSHMSQLVFKDLRYWQTLLKSRIVFSCIRVLCGTHLVCGAVVWVWLKGFGMTSLLLPLCANTDFVPTWLILLMAWNREKKILISICHLFITSCYNGDNIFW